MIFTDIILLERTDMVYKGTCEVDENEVNFHMTVLQKENKTHLWARFDGICSEKWNTGEPDNWVFELAVELEIINIDTCEVDFVGILKELKAA